MAQDITKNTGDIENYTKEFVELQSQLSQIRNEKFNGISLFASTSSAAAGSLLKGTGSYINESGTSLSTTTFSRTLTTHASADSTLGSVSINVINFQFMLSVGTIASGATGIDLGNVNGSNSGSGIGSNSFINDILEVSISQFIEIIGRVADMRAENGAEQNRVMNTISLLQSNMVNLESAHGRIMDTDIAAESTRFARHNILVQASASMTAQANQLSSVALSLIG